jgi:lipopolysaccharide biosynthesis regulator YciM
MFAEMIALEHRRREHLRRGENDKAAEIAKLMHEKAEGFRRERAAVVRELKRELEAALSKGDFAEAVMTANKINELGPER